MIRHPLWYGLICLLAVTLIICCLAAALSGELGSAAYLALPAVGVTVRAIQLRPGNRRPPTDERVRSARRRSVSGRRS